MPNNAPGICPSITLSAESLSTPIDLRQMSPADLALQIRALARLVFALPERLQISSIRVAEESPEDAIEQARRLA